MREGAVADLEKALWRIVGEWTGSWEGGDDALGQRGGRGGHVDGADGGV